MLPDQLSIMLGAEGHDLPIRNRHLDNEVQALLVLRVLALCWFLADDTLALPPGVSVCYVSLKEVYSRL